MDTTVPAQDKLRHLNYQKMGGSQFVCWSPIAGRLTTRLTPIKVMLGEICGPFTCTFAANEGEYEVPSAEPAVVQAIHTNAPTIDRSPML